MVLIHTQSYFELFKNIKVPKQKSRKVPLMPLQSRATGRTLTVGQGWIPDYTDFLNLSF